MDTIYAKADKRVYHKDSDGIESLLDQWIELKLASDHTNSTTTSQDVPGLGFTPVANALYVIEATLPCTAGAITTGPQYALSGPASGITWSAVTIKTPTASNAETPFHGALNGAAPMTAGLTQPSLVRVYAMVQVGAAPAAGNIRMQVKSEVASSAIITKAGAFMRYRAI
jgi:hypothetical protein